VCELRLHAVPPLRLDLAQVFLELRRPPLPAGQLLLDATPRVVNFFPLHLQQEVIT